MPYARPAHSTRRAPRVSAAARGYDRRWRKLRLVVLDRDPICCDCAAASSVDVHHIVKKADGGADDLDNLMGLCKACHSVRTAKGE